MFDWIIPWFARGWSGISDLANAVAGAVNRVAHLFISEFLTWASMATYLWMAAQYCWQASIRFFGSLVRFAGRVAFVYLPAQALKAFNDAVAYAERRVTDVVNFVQARIDQLVHGINALVADVRSWVSGQFAAVITWLTNLAKTVDGIATKVITLLTNPRALADWLAGEIVGAVGRWVRTNADALARLLLAQAVSGTVRIVALLEKVIADTIL